MTLSADQFERVLRLNNQFALETSFLEEIDLERLTKNAYVVKTIGELDAFLICMSHASPHDGINFGWFKQRFQSFIYVDRIVTADHARGQGLARRLYEHAMETAKADGIKMICCEINHEPPNPGSVAFHEKLGFKMIDTTALSEEKTVGYWVKDLTI